MAYPSPTSLEDLFICWLLVGAFFVADGVRPADLEDSSQTGVDEGLDLVGGVDSGRGKGGGGRGGGVGGSDSSGGSDCSSGSV